MFSIEDLMAEFERCAAEAERREWKNRQIFVHEQDDEQRVKAKKTHEREEKAEKEALDALATTQQIEALNVQIVRYDTATVEALMENREALDQVHARMEAIQANAFVLPDGRRVYPTAKRDAVFDEQGTRLSHDIIDPRLIPAGKSTVEEKTGAWDQARALEETRSKVLAFQAKNDAAAERVAKGGLTSGDVTAMGKELEDNAPQAVKDVMARSHTGIAAAPVAAPPQEAIAITPADMKLARPVLAYQ